MNTYCRQLRPGKTTAWEALESCRQSRKTEMNRFMVWNSPLLYLLAFVFLVHSTPKSNCFGVTFPSPWIFNIGFVIVLWSRIKGDVCTPAEGRARPRDEKIHGTVTFSVSLPTSSSWLPASAASAASAGLKRRWIGKLDLASHQILGREKRKLLRRSVWPPKVKWITFPLQTYPTCWLWPSVYLGFVLQKMAPTTVL